MIIDHHGGFVSPLKLRARRKKLREERQSARVQKRVEAQKIQLLNGLSKSQILKERRMDAARGVAEEAEALQAAIRFAKKLGVSVRLKWSEANGDIQMDAFAPLSGGQQQTIYSGPCGGLLNDR